MRAKVYNLPRRNEYLARRMMLKFLADAHLFNQEQLIAINNYIREVRNGTGEN